MVRLPQGQGGPVLEMLLLRQTNHFFGWVERGRKGPTQQKRARTERGKKQGTTDLLERVEKPAKKSFACKKKLANRGALDG